MLDPSASQSRIRLSDPRLRFPDVITFRRSNFEANGSPQIASPVYFALFGLPNAERSAVEYEHIVDLVRLPGVEPGTNGL